MTETRFLSLRAQAAQLVNAAKPHLFPEEQLFSTLEAIVLPKPLRSEFDYVMSEMERAGQLLRHRGERNVVKCKLTETGEAELL